MIWLECRLQSWCKLRWSDAFLADIFCCVFISLVRGKRSAHIYIFFLTRLSAVSGLAAFMLNWVLCVVFSWISSGKAEFHTGQTALLQVLALGRMRSMSIQQQKYLLTLFIYLFIFVNVVDNVEWSFQPYWQSPVTI